MQFLDTDGYLRAGFTSTIANEHALPSLFACLVCPKAFVPREYTYSKICTYRSNVYYQKQPQILTVYSDHGGSSHFFDLLKVCFSVHHM
jgi:hypothetical protein